MRENFSEAGQTGEGLRARAFTAQGSWVGHAVLVPAGAQVWSPFFPLVEGAGSPAVLRVVTSGDYPRVKTASLLEIPTLRVVSVRNEGALSYVLISSISFFVFRKKKERKPPLPPATSQSPIKTGRFLAGSPLGDHPQGTRSTRIRVPARVWSPSPTLVNGTSVSVFRERSRSQQATFTPSNEPTSSCLYRVVFLAPSERGSK
jgi:hypothetical protein